ncbi:hypothetical protein LTR27_008719 [Elasticomyces elasticus]|nr:hypothetical protein LTR27_008719 [Elasticomyces elasticus]
MSASGQWQGTPTGPHRSLDPAFKMRRDPKRFFVVGKVFRGVWSEPSELRVPSTSCASEAWSQDSFGLWVHTKVRLFVVIDASDRSCTAVAITSYNSQGVDKPGVNASDHSVIYTGRTVPVAPESCASMMQPYPIWVDQDSVEKLDPMSRLDFRKPYTLHHTLRVKPFGKVNRASMVHLQTQYRNVQFGEHPMATSARSTGNALTSLPTNQLMVPVYGSQSNLANQAILTLMAAGWSQELASQVVRDPINEEDTRSV